MFVYSPKYGRTSRPPSKKNLFPHRPWRLCHAKKRAPTSPAPQPKNGIEATGRSRCKVCGQRSCDEKRKPQPCYSLFMHNIICIYKYIYIYRLNDAHENEELHISLWDTTVGLGVYIWPHCRVEALDSQLHQQKHQHKQGKWGTIQIQ